MIILDRLRGSCSSELVHLLPSFLPVSGFDNRAREVMELLGVHFSLRVRISTFVAEASPHTDRIAGIRSGPITLRIRFISNSCCRN